jgi:competence protein ComEA
VNEVMPQGRVFGTNLPGDPPIGSRQAPGRVSGPGPGPGPGPGQGLPPRPVYPSAQGPGPTHGAPRPVPPWVVPLLSGLGGAAGATALVLAGVFLLGVPGVAGGGLPADVGESLDTALLVGAETEPWLPAGQEIVVDVAGAVARPGLHRLRSGDRVGDAIQAAGGYAPRVDLAAASLSLNLAQSLEDGTKVLVPELGIDRLDQAAGDGRIDLNRADQAELETLPGVGPVTARKIIDARAEQPFSSARDLRSRGLVGESVFSDIESLVHAS